MHEKILSVKNTLDHDYIITAYKTAKIADCVNIEITYMAKNTSNMQKKHSLVNFFN